MHSPQAGNSTRPVGHIEVVIGGARENITVLLGHVVALEQAADRVSGSTPTPIAGPENEKGIAPSPADPPLMQQLHAANEDMAMVLARLERVANRFLALA